MSKLKIKNENLFYYLFVKIFNYLEIQTPYSKYITYVLKNCTLLAENILVSFSKKDNFTEIHFVKIYDKEY